MNKLIFFLLPMFLLVAASYWYLFADKSDMDLPLNGTAVTKSSENFTLTAQYKETSKWEYKVEGNLPNPCYSVEVDVVVQESYPEQVIVKIESTPPSSNDICIQVIEEYEYTGEFTASEEATVLLDVI